MSQIIKSLAAGPVPPTVATAYNGNSGTAVPSGNVLNVVTANSTVQFVGSGSTLTQDFGISNLALGSTLPSLTSGIENVIIGKNTGANITNSSFNVIGGYNAGHLLSTGGDNIIFGVNACANSTNITNCVAIGSGALSQCVFGPNADNVCIGTSSLVSLTMGSRNIALGFQSGMNYTSSESSNILIGNPGTLAESNAIHIGTQGSGAGQQNSCTIAGIVGVTASNPQLVTVNSSTGQLGVQAALTGVVSGSGTGPLVAHIPIMYADGADGAQTFDGSSVVLGLTPSSMVYTLTRDIYLGSSTVNNGVTIITNGFRIYCNGTLTNNGTIHNNGVTGTVGGGGGFGGGSGTTASGTSMGGAGETTAGFTGGSVLGYGGTGGTGGAGVSSGGAAGTLSTLSALQGGIHTSWSYIFGSSFATGTITRFSGGSGGGGGGGDGINKGGGGGGGGNILLICAYQIAGTGTLSSNGGTGGAGAVGGTNCGGGGGGGGGIVYVTSTSLSSGSIPGQTITAAFGNGGAATGLGSNGNNGSPGLVLLSGG